MRDIVSANCDAKVIDLKISNGNTSAKITAWNIDAEFLMRFVSGHEVR